MLTNNSSKELHGLPQITQSYAEKCIKKTICVNLHNQRDNKIMGCIGIKKDAYNK